MGEKTHGWSSTYLKFWIFWNELKGDLKLEMGSWAPKLSLKFLNLNERFDKVLERIFVSYRVEKWLSIEDFTFKWALGYNPNVLELSWKNRARNALVRGPSMTRTSRESNNYTNPSADSHLKLKISENYFSLRVF